MAGFQVVKKLIFPFACRGFGGGRDLPLGGDSQGSVGGGGGVSEVGRFGRCGRWGRCVAVWGRCGH